MRHASGFDTLRLVLALLLMAALDIVSPAMVAAEAQSDPAGDLGAEILGGLAGLTAGAGVGMLSLVVTLPTFCDRGGDLCGLGAFAVSGSVAVVGALVLVPAGISVAGAASGGRGSFAFSLLGGFSGALLGALGVATGLEAGVQAEMLFAVPPALAISGAVIGYRWSAPDRWSAAVVPTLDGAAFVVRSEI